MYLAHDDALPLDVQCFVMTLPAWFQEGLAVFVSGGGAESATPEAARRAIVAGRTFAPEDEGPG